MAQSSIMHKLAWRAKWRKRWQQYKSFVVLLAVILVGGMLYCASNPAMLYDYSFGEITEARLKQPLPEGAVKWKYRMGFFLSSTIRKDEGGKHYQELWRDWYLMNGKTTGIERGNLYVGRAIYEHAMQYRLKKQKGMASDLFALFVQDFANTPGITQQQVEIATMNIKKVNTNPTNDM